MTDTQKQKFYEIADKLTRLDDKTKITGFTKITEDLISETEAYATERVREAVEKEIKDCIKLMESACVARFMLPSFIPKEAVEKNLYGVIKEQLEKKLQHLAGEDNIEDGKNGSNKRD